MARIKTYELRKKPVKDLDKQLNDLRKELSELAVSKVTGSGASKLYKILTVRKAIARVLTVINQKNKAVLRHTHKRDKFLPLTLRKKYTRRIRRELTTKQKFKLTVRMEKKVRNFPRRKFALKV